ncbi:MAG: peroxiredoxin [Dehalococcoidia bacterium]|nr:peroxiredoxin [Dehalococcoidia bacterium]
MLKIGTEAPAFEAPLDDGGTFRLSERRGNSTVVLYFYPKDETPGCVREACGFRDNYEEIQRAGATVIGVSTDTAERHRSFRAHHGLPFPLAADVDKRVSELYEARGLFGLMTARTTYVIDRTGVIRAAFRHEFAIGGHTRDVLAALRKIGGPAGGDAASP